jgi:hypothetical protein
MGLDVAIALVLPKPRANVYSFPDNVCNLNNLPISDEIAVRWTQLRSPDRGTCGCQAGPVSGQFPFRRHPPPMNLNGLVCRKPKE